MFLAFLLYIIIVLIIIIYTVRNIYVLYLTPLTRRHSSQPKPRARPSSNVGTFDGAHACEIVARGPWVNGGWNPFSNHANWENAVLTCVKVFTLIGKSLLFPCLKANPKEVRFLSSKLRESRWKVIRINHFGDSQFRAS